MKPSSKRAIRAAIYCRCSTDEQWKNKEFSTLESQANICKHAVAMKEPDGWSLGQIYEDGGYSGGSTQRPALDQLMADIHSGQINAVVVYRLDRLTRSIADFYELWKVFEEHSVIFVSATEAFSTDTPTGELFLNLLLSLSQWERETIRTRVTDKIAERAKLGYWHGGNPPYGYDYSIENKLLTPNKGESTVVKDIFNRIIEGLAPIEVARLLNEDGLRTKARQRKSADGTPKPSGAKRWVGQNVTRIVRNPLYKGIIEHHGDHYPSKHQAIIADKLWKEANKALQEGHVPILPTRRSNRHQMLLKGLLKCDHCGNALVPKPAGKKDKDGNPYLYYTCGDLNKHGKKTECALRNVPARAFEDYIIKLISELGQHPEIIKSTAEAAKAEHGKTVMPFQAKLKETSKALEAVSAEVASLVQMAKKPEMKAMSGEFMAEANDLGQRKTELQAEKQKLQMEIDFRRNLVTDEAIICERLSDFAGLFEELEFEERAELLGLLFNEIRVSRFDPEKDQAPCGKDVFETKMRTSWYRVDLRLFSNMLSISDMLEKRKKVPQVRSSGENGGE